MHNPKDLRSLKVCDIVRPDLIREDVHAHLVQSKVVRLGHLFSIRRKTPFRLLHVGEVALPEINVKNLHQASLEQLCNGRMKFGRKQKKAKFKLLFCAVGKYVMEPV